MPRDPRIPRASFYPSGYAFRLAAMVGVLVLIGATIYNQRSRARIGKAAAEDLKQQAKEWRETIVPGPADDDPAEIKEAQRLFEGVFDKRELVEPDMPAYWRLMKWARSR